MLPGRELYAQSRLVAWTIVVVLRARGDGEHRGIGREGEGVALGGCLKRRVAGVLLNVRSRSCVQRYIPRGVPSRERQRRTPYHSVCCQMRTRKRARIPWMLNWRRIVRRGGVAASKGQVGGGVRKVYLQYNDGLADRLTGAIKRIGHPAAKSGPFYMVEYTEGSDSSLAAKSSFLDLVSRGSLLDSRKSPQSPEMCVTLL